MTAHRRPQASYGGIIKVHDALSKALVKREDGIVEYTSGHSDQTIGSALNISDKLVAKVRTETFGRLATNPAGLTGPRLASIDTSLRVLESELNDLKRVVMNIAEKQGELGNLPTLVARIVDEHDRLCDELTINRIWLNARARRINPPHATNGATRR